MSYPSRMRPRSNGQHPTHAGQGGQSNGGSGILETARAQMERLDERHEVKARINPLNSGQLKQEELKARMHYGRSRRDGLRGGALLLPLLGWGLARVSRFRPVRAVNLFFFHYGTVMAAGAAYMMFFSVAAMLFSSFAIAGLIIGGNEELQGLIVNAANTVLPGIVGYGENALVAPQELFSASGLGLGLAIAVPVTVVTSLSWLHGLRSGIRSIWERPLMAENVLVVKGRDLGLMFVLGLIVLTTAGLSVLTADVIDEVWEFFNWDHTSIYRRLTRAATWVIPLGLDMIMAVLLMRVASRLVMPISALWQVALIAGVGASVLRLGSSQLLQNFAGSENPLLGSFATVLGLFFYFYLFALVYLVAAAWGAIAAADHEERGQ